MECLACTKYHADAGDSVVFLTFLEVQVELDNLEWSHKYIIETFLCASAEKHRELWVPTTVALTVREGFPGKVMLKLSSDE